MRSIRVGFALGLLICCSKFVAAERPAGGEVGVAAITLSDLVRRVIERNESVQAKLLDFEVNQRKYNAERGVFEPEGFASGSREVNNRQNNSQQAAADAGISALHENNKLYAAGVETLAPSGGRIRLGYTLSDLFNNIPPGAFQAPLTSGQFQSFAGVTLTQPLLKNSGSDATMAGIRLAALSSKIAFQEYRR